MRLEGFQVNLTAKSPYATVVGVQAAQATNIDWEELTGLDCHIGRSDLIGTQAAMDWHLHPSVKHGKCGTLFKNNMHYHDDLGLGGDTWFPRSQFFSDTELAASIGPNRTVATLMRLQSGLDGAQMPVIEANFPSTYSIGVTGWPQIMSPDVAADYNHQIQIGYTVNAYVTIFFKCKGAR